MASYLPKATVQAAIGSVPLAAGLSCGNTVLSTAVVGIIITAPSGAFLIDFLSGRLLQRGGRNKCRRRQQRCDKPRKGKGAVEQRKRRVGGKTVNIHTIRKRQVPTTVQRAEELRVPSL